MSEKKLRIIPLGGLGEVGKNMMAYEYGKNILIVDTGIMFPENDMLGIDYIIPDFNYLMDKIDWVRGIVITHGHEDHVGAINHVLEHMNAPIYATPLTRGLVEVKLRRGGTLDKAQLNTVRAGDEVNIGPFRMSSHCLLLSESSCSAARKACPKSRLFMRIYGPIIPQIGAFSKVFAGGQQIL